MTMLLNALKCANKVKLIVIKYSCGHTSICKVLDFTFNCSALTDITFKVNIF